MRIFFGNMQTEYGEISLRSAVWFGFLHLYLMSEASAVQYNTVECNAVQYSRARTSLGPWKSNT